jgi:hypothetical protein
MSYANTSCPCGGRKQADAMLCTDCVSAFSDSPAMAIFLNPLQSFETRRPAAIRLLAMSRRRKNNVLF